MKFIKLTIVYFCILISINAYAKCDELCSKEDYALKVPRGTKVNWEFHPPGSHSHYPCKIEEGHWHYGVLNQNPANCNCKANYSSKKNYVCGQDRPAEYNDIMWTNDDD